MVPFWIPIIVRHLNFEGTQNGVIILTATHLRFWKWCCSICIEPSCKVEVGKVSWFDTPTSGQSIVESRLVRGSPMKVKFLEHYSGPLCDVGDPKQQNLFLGGLDLAKMFLIQSQTFK